MSSILPVVVGATALLVLDGQLGNLTPDVLRRLFQNPLLRGATLFGAAYTGNGGKILPALLTSYIYLFLYKSVQEQLREENESGEQKDIVDDLVFQLNPFKTADDRPV